MPFIIVYRTADIYISAQSKLRVSAKISAVQYTNLICIVYENMYIHICAQLRTKTYHGEIYSNYVLRLVLYDNNG